MAGISVRVFESELLSLVQAIADGSEELIRSEVKNIYENIWQSSPTLTHYYQANHRILIRRGGGQFGTGGANLSPRVKPTDAQPGQFADNAAETLANEPMKLNSFNLGDTIELFNDVPYAEDIERHRNIYGTAFAVTNLV